MIALPAIPLLIVAALSLATIIELQSAHRLSPRVWRCSRPDGLIRETKPALAGAYSRGA